jgi:lysyl-tRNA synthetase class 2
MSEDKYYQDRKKKLETIREFGLDPYGGRFPDARHAADVRKRAEALDIQAGQILEDQQARVAGRVVLLRVMGKLAFLTIRDGSGDLQFGLSKSRLPDQWRLIKQLDLGDIIGADGCLGRTKAGELTLWVDKLSFLCKALQGPPEKWHGLQDTDLRYRRRYVDLFANPEVREVFKARSKIIDAARRTLVDRGFYEVETPVLQPIYGGAAARPFTTHHNTLDMDLYLRISPELYLKRLLVGGIERVFEFSRNFRNEGISTQHNPEFTLLELYQAYGDYNDMMEITEALFTAGIEATGGHFRRPFGPHEIDYTTPWPRERYADLFEQYAGIKMRDIAAVREKAAALDIEHAKMDDAVVVNEVFEKTVEPQLIQPTFVLDYPAPLCPLTRRQPDDSSIALRFEAFVAGMEVGNAYTELNDPAVQEENFSKTLAGQEDETMAVMDQDFLLSLRYGMPPAGGLGIGVDRMVMLLTNSTSIRDVILFPLQRPQPDQAKTDQKLEAEQT